MSLVVTSLNATTTTGPGAVASFDVPRSDITMQISASGAAGSETYDVALEGSLDGVNWISLGQGSGTGAGSQFVKSTGTPVLFARANLISESFSSLLITAVVAASLD